MQKEEDIYASPEMEMRESFLAKVTSELRKGHA